MTTINKLIAILNRVKETVGGGSNTRPTDPLPQLVMVILNVTLRIVMKLLSLQFKVASL